MKKQKIQLIIIIVLLVVFVGGYFGLKKYNKVKDEEASTDSYEVLTLDESTINEINIVTTTDSDTATLDLVKKDDTWVLSSDESQNIDQDLVTTMLDTVNDVTANNEITDVTDFDQYGLETPCKVITLTAEDGTTTVINIGDYSSSASRYYARIGDNATVYLVASTLNSAFDKSEDDLIVTDSSDAASSDASEDITAEASALDSTEALEADTEASLSDSSDAASTSAE